VSTRPFENGGGLRRPLLSLIRFVDKVLTASGAAVIFVTLLVTFFALLINVILRYVFGDGLAWAYEIHAIFFPWLVAGGIVIASVRGRHIAVDVVVNLLPEGPRRIFAIAASLLVCAIAISVVYTSQPIVNASKFQRLSEIPVSQYWGYISLYYAFAAMAVQSALNALRLVFAYESVADRDDPTQASFS